MAGSVTVGIPARLRDEPLDTGRGSWPGRRSFPVLSSSQDLRDLVPTVWQTASLVALALFYWTRFPVPPLSPSRLERLPVGDGLADDPGLYWITGPLMRLTGLDAQHAIWLLAIAAFAVALALTVRRGFLPTIALVLSAPLSIGFGGPYWIPAWAVWMALPVSPRVSGALGVAVTVFRSTAGLPVIAWAFRSWKAGVGSVVGFLLVTMFAGGHVFWHTAYIGLGWYPNPWGIAYLDASGMAATTAPYASPAYEAALRSLVIAHVLERPDFIVAEIGAKLRDALALAMPWVLAVPLVVWRRPAFALPLLAALAPLLVSVPDPAYATGWVAVVLYGVTSWSRDDARVLSRPRMPARAAHQREQEPAARDVVVAPGPG